MVNLDLLAQPSIVQRAQAGDFRAIAYWLNAYLVPQELYARVAADRPGWLVVLVEFSTPPSRDRLTRFICYRLSRLRSNLIQGVRIIARPLGAVSSQWEQSIRLAPGDRPLSVAPVRRRSRRRSPQKQPYVALAAQLRQRRQPAATKHDGLESVNRVSTAAVQAFSTAVQELIASVQQVQPSQALQLGRWAAAVFLVGCGAELLHQMAPWRWFGGPTVETAAGRVPVIQVADEATGTAEDITLTFSSDPALQQLDLPASGAIAAQPADPTEPAVAALAVQTTTDSAGGWGSPTPIASPTAATTAFPTEPLITEGPADVSLTHLEQPLTQPEAKATTASADDSDKTARVVNVGSDRLLQKGAQPLLKTLNTLEREGTHTLGAGRNQREARRPEIVEVRGKRIAYFAYSDSDAHAAGWLSAGTNPAIAQHIADDLASIRSQVDWVVVNYRWGKDLANFPSEQQMQLARHAIDHGADLVVGYHPRALQGAEVYKGRAIAYSLGDFVLPDQPPADAQVASPADYNTAMLKVSLKQDQMRLEFVPVQVQQSQPAIAQGETGQSILRYLNQASALFEQPLRSPLILDRQAPAAAPAPFAPVAAPASDSFTNYSTPTPLPITAPSNEQKTLPAPPVVPDAAPAPPASPAVDLPAAPAPVAETPEPALPTAEPSVSGPLSLESVPSARMQSEALPPEAPSSPAGQPVPAGAEAAAAEDPLADQNSPEEDIANPVL